MPSQVKAATGFASITTLHRAVETSDYELVVRMLDAGADVEARDAQGNTPLHVAATAGNVGLLSHLITPTTLNVRNSKGLTPLQLALVHQHWAAASALVAAGASTHSLGGSQVGAGLLGQEGGVPDPTIELLAMLADPGPAGLLPRALRWQDARGVTALHMAASEGCQQRVTNLLAAGADRHARNKAGATPLMLAVMGGHWHLLPLLAAPLVSQQRAAPPVPAAAAAVGDQEQRVRPVQRRRRGVKIDLAQFYVPPPPGSQFIVNATAPLKNRQHPGVPAMAAQEGDMQLVTQLLSALFRERGTQQSGQTDGFQKQQQQWRVKEVAAMVAPLAQDLQDVPRCVQLLAVVLDMLGPEVAGEVCVGVQRRLERWLRAQPGSHRLTTSNSVFWWYVEFGRRHHNYLAEALLLGWLGAEGRRLVPARLQRLVMGVVKGSKKAAREPQQLYWTLVDALERAVTKTAEKEQQRADALLGACAELYLQQGPQDSAGGADMAWASAEIIPPDVLWCGRPARGYPPIPGLNPPGTTSEGTMPRQGRHNQGCVPPLVQLVHEGIKAVCKAQTAKIQWATVPGTQATAEYRARTLDAGEVHGGLLAAWVAARGTHRQELPGVVVTAVTSLLRAQQQEQQRQQQQQVRLVPAEQQQQRQQQSSQTPEEAEVEELLSSCFSFLHTGE